MAGHLFLLQSNYLTGFRLASLEVEEVMRMWEVEAELERVRREYEDVQREYEIKDARGIPMSVHERYRGRLSGLLEKIQALEIRAKRDVGVPAG